MKNIIIFALLFLLVFQVIPSGYVDAAATAEQIEKKLNAAVKGKQWTNAAIFSKQLAVYFDDRKEYEKAVPHYRRSAEYWEKAGHGPWGIVNIIRADHIDTNIELMVEQTGNLVGQLAKFEPPSGTYLGMFAAGKREGWRVDNVDEIYGKNHAIFLTYTSWRKQYPETNSYFPVAFAEEAKKQGGAIQIGWEPMNGLDDVLDDEYVRQFAREAKEVGIPVFLRYAGEMNGEWVPWSGNPEKYKQKFKMIHDIMAEEAPNVAMVWSPNFLPRENIDPYYPGDDVVDWVGFSLYTIPYSHGEEVLGGNAIDYLRPLYETYSHKPIMISEGAISHYSYELGKDYSNWAAGQIGNMYGFLPKLYPKVKAITYFNLDKQTTNYDNQNNNYDLADSTVVDQAYQRIIRDSWFLDKVAASFEGHQATKYVPIIEQADRVSGSQKAFVYVKLPLGQQPYYVAAYQGDKKLGESYAQPWEFNIDFAAVHHNQPITVIAFDKTYKRLATKEFKLN